MADWTFCIKKCTQKPILFKKFTYKTLISILYIWQEKFTTG